MRRWLRSWNIPLADADDILQDACLRVFRSIHKFQHRGQGSFRAWLKEVSRSCWLQVIRKTAYRARLERQCVDINQLVSEETLCSIDQQIDLLIEQEFFDCALARTRNVCSELAWNAYRLTALDGLSGSQAAERLGISLNCVYKNKQRFETCFQETLRTLRDTD
ncbi:MAG: RNA polymerase sigma factor [Planctomycetota bacterium]